MNIYTKTERQKLLAEILERQDPGRQTELLLELRKRGAAVTQATVSRDLQEMGYVRLRIRPGVFRYERLDSPGTERLSQRLKVLFAHFVSEIKGVGNMILVKTSPGNANGVASLIDGLRDPVLLGTVAGDDTILVVVDNEKNRKRIEHEFRSLL
jgi:transcriptional regulator of arginine metabolism